MSLQREDVDYFGAGPAPLPTEVLQEACKALLNYNGMGIGIVEMSHRSPEATKILQDTKLALKELLDIPDDYEVIFTQGGGSGQFSEVVYHMVGIWVERQRALCESKWGETYWGEFQKAVKQRLRLDYLVTGSWSLKASQEAARLVGSDHVHIVTDAREQNQGKFGTIPPEDQWKVDRPTALAEPDTPQQSAFTYYCDNETVDGVEFPGFPKFLETGTDPVDRLVVADMSSNILSRRVDVAKYAAIFAGAQKNIGTTGVTFVILRRSLLPEGGAKLPSAEVMRKLGLAVGPVALDWATLAKNNSLYNTLPIFDVWIAGQVMTQLLKHHGSNKIQGQEIVANKKAEMVYKLLDQHPTVYQVVPDRDVRSRMNICLRIAGSSAKKEEEFLKGAKDLNLTGLKGHRSVGGIRISNCEPVMKTTFRRLNLADSIKDNAVTVDAIEKLVQYMRQYAESYKP